MKRGFKWDKKYLYWGITAFCVIAASVAFFLLLNRFGEFKAAVAHLFKILSPFVFGSVLAYLLCPFMLWVERGLFGVGKMSEKKKKRTESTRLSRNVSVLIVELAFLLLLAALIYIILPQLYTSIETIVLNSRSYVESLTQLGEKLLYKYPQVEELVAGFTGDFTTTAINWLTGKVLPGMGNWVTALTTALLSVVYNLFVGIVVSCYLLAKVESVSARLRRLLYSVFTIEASDRICQALRFSDRTMKNFLGGKILDSAIVGVVCYILFVIIKMPYPLLIAVIIGVTNIIPQFGPFIGAIPSAIFILMVSPKMCLIFVILILVIQQLDGQILGPKILGSSVGVSGFWIMFSIILGAGFFGFWGMLLGVPVFVIVYAGFNLVIEKKLKRSGLPAEVSAYRDLDHIDPITYEVVKKTPKEE